MIIDPTWETIVGNIGPASGPAQPAKARKVTRADLVERTEMVRRMTDREAQELYDQLNQEFFGGALPTYTVKFKSEAEMPIGAYADMDPFDNVVIIWKDGTRSVREPLLHEMIHIKLFQPGYTETPEAADSWRMSREYGYPLLGCHEHLTREFQVELARLAERGEAWAARELAKYRSFSQREAKYRTERGLPLNKWCGDLFEG